MILATAALVIGVLIGFLIGTAMSAGHAADDIRAAQVERLEVEKDLQARLDAVAATGKFVIAIRDDEIEELKKQLAAERRARVRETAQPAGWGNTDPVTEITT